MKDAMKKLVLLTWAFLFLCCVCYGLTKLTSAAIVNSTVDSTPIGRSVAAPGTFTQLEFATGNSGSATCDSASNPGDGAMYIECHFGSSPANFLTFSGLSNANLPQINLNANNTTLNGTETLQVAPGPTDNSSLVPTTAWVRTFFSSQHQIYLASTSSVCTTANSSGSTCANTVNLGTTLSGTYYPACSLIGTTGYPFIVNIAENSTFMTVTISNGVSNMAVPATAQFIYCTVIQ